jgi:hypothetical protein
MQMIAYAEYRIFTYKTSDKWWRRPLVKGIGAAVFVWRPAKKKWGVRQG